MMTMSVVACSLFVLDDLVFCSNTNNNDVLASIRGVLGSGKLCVSGMDNKNSEIILVEP